MINLAWRETSSKKVVAHPVGSADSSLFLDVLRERLARLVGRQ